ncbi:MAG TPA: hypothetical protein VMW07_05585 [Gallionella sp.]|nr:hypothetical protein [Gallionella sp.]
MPNKRSNNLYYVFGGLAILFGLFMFWATSDIPLPNNAKKEGSMIHIDLSDGATDEREIKESLFIVPDKFKPRVSEGVIAIYIKFPNGTPYTGNDFPLPPDQVRVVIKHRAKSEGRSEYSLRHTQPKDGLLKNVPYFVESKDGLEIYQYDYGSKSKTIGTYFNFVAKDGNNILVDDPGDWSRDYIIDRKLSPHIEITYLLPRLLVRDSKHFVEDVTIADNVVLKLVQSFQFK